MNTLPTVGEFTRAAAAKLAALVRPVIGSAPSASSPRLDAEVLVMHACGLNRAELITRADTPLCQTACVRLDEFLQRRLAGEPIAYITGKREFWSLELLITPAVLIPRPETELLVERALVHIPANAEWTIADIGTGSGAIALALAKERPRSRVIAT
ncbi:MAG: peptide chain release factor N(5)-glutamine methyltransferase, partial [Pseudomonadota bacterium]